MSSIKGWEGTVKYSNRIVAENVGTGNDVLVNFDLDYEADDELGEITDLATKIEVFFDGVLQATTGIYTLDGDGGAAGVGRVTFNTAPTTGVVITVSYYTYQVIGYVQSIGINHGNNVDPVHELGNRGPVELKEGNIDISLSLERCFINLGLISMVVHEISALRGWLSAEEFDIDLFPKGTTGGNPLLTVRGKFNDYSLSMPQDGLAMDSVGFVGKTITPTTA